MSAVAGILLKAAREDRQNAGRRCADANRRLGLLEARWSLQRLHLDALRARFTTIETMRESSDPIDGTRVDLLMQ